MLRVCGGLTPIADTPLACTSAYMTPRVRPRPGSFNSSDASCSISQAIFLVIFFFFDNAGRTGVLASRAETCLPHLHLGRWNSSGPAPLWRSIEATGECGIKDGLDLTIASNLSVLLFGDSFERIMVQDICNLALSRGLESQSQQQQLPEAIQNEHLAPLGYDAITSCRLHSGYLQQTGFTMGVWPTGPYWLTNAHSGSPPQERVVQAHRLFLQQWPAQPDIVVFNANYWDSFRFITNEYGITNEDVLETWKGHFSDLLDLATELFPRAAKFYHTSLVKVYNDKLREPVIADLNREGPSLAYQAGWQVVDLNRLVENFEGFGYLRDPHHPQSFILTAFYDMLVSSAAELLPRRRRGQT